MKDIQINKHMDDGIKQVLDAIFQVTIKAPSVFILDRWWLLLPSSLIIFILIISYFKRKK